MRSWRCHSRTTLKRGNYCRTAPTAGLSPQKGSLAYEASKSFLRRLRSRRPTASRTVLPSGLPIPTPVPFSSPTSGNGKTSKRRSRDSASTTLLSRVTGSEESSYSRPVASTFSERRRPWVGSLIPQATCALLLGPGRTGRLGRRGIPDLVRSSRAQCPGRSHSNRWCSRCNASRRNSSQ